jgi:hypothetical protein
MYVCDVKEKWPYSSSSIYKQSIHQNPGNIPGQLYRTCLCRGLCMVPLTYLPCLKTMSRTANARYVNSQFQAFDLDLDLDDLGQGHRSSGVQMPISKVRDFKSGIPAISSTDCTITPLTMIGPVHA